MGLGYAFFWCHLHVNVIVFAKFILYFFMDFILHSIIIPSIVLLVAVHFVYCMITTFYLQHLFSCVQPQEFIKACIDTAFRNLGITLRKRKQAITFNQFVNYRFGDYSSDEHITSMAEFQVQKITHKSLVTN